MAGPGGDDLLFSDAARDLAGQQPAEAPFRWLVLSDDPEAVHLRSALERGFALTGESATRLRNGLASLRWGQHVGALAQLLLLAAFDAEGYPLTADPDLDGQRPDILIDQHGCQALVEVRAITGMGRKPWVARAQQRGDQAKAPEALGQVLTNVLLKKAAAYDELVRRRRLPYMIALYRDTDTSLPPLLRDVAFGPATEFKKHPDRWGQAPDGGLLAEHAADLSAVSAIGIFGRQDDDDGVLRLSGELLLNPHAELPYPPALIPASWRVLRSEAVHAPDAKPDAARGSTAARMSWATSPTTPREWRL